MSNVFIFGIKAEKYLITCYLLQDKRLGKQMPLLREYFISILLFLLITLHLPLSGCATYGALQKVEPQEKLLRYDSVCISQKNELTFNFTVSLKETQKEEDWCAKMPMEKIIGYSTAVNEAIPWNSPASEAFYNSLYAISAWNYALIKSQCSCSDIDKIPYREIGIGWLGEEIVFWEKSAPIKFISPKSFVRKMDYGYIVLKTAEPIGKMKVTKIELPLPVDVYDMKKITFCLFTLSLT